MSNGPESFDPLRTALETPPPGVVPPMAHSPIFEKAPQNLEKPILPPMACIKAVPYEKTGEDVRPLLPTHDGKPVLNLSSVTLESRCFEGPLGDVFLGHHHGIDAPVVVRVMHPSVKGLMRDFDRFVRETRKLIHVRHSAIAGLLDMGAVQDFHYIVMEYVCGVPLIDRIQAKPLSQALALQFLIPIAEGLCEFWKKGFVHRSVSPYTIHLQSCGSPKLDLSILSRNHYEPQFKAFVGACMTPYWAPEEIRNLPVDATSDMWSFGVTLYQAVTGQMPFQAKTENGLRASILEDEPLDPIKANPEILPPFRDLLLKLLSKRPEERFISTEAFLLALRSVESQISGKVSLPAAGFFSEMKTPAPKPVTTPRALGIGDVVGNCRLEKKLGSGAFGVVYLARHRVLEINVAVKLLPLDHVERDPGYVEMFLREARTAARLRHPNVINIYEAGVQDGQHYIIMEYAPGGTVWDKMHLDGGRLSVAEGLKVLLGAARGLSAAEKVDIVHRDIKPDNLMYGTHGDVKIADLGLAKRLMRADDAGMVRESLMADQLSLRGEPGMMAGTPAYMAPETAVEPETVDTRADLYSLGVTAYQYLTGSLPFEGKTPMETIMKHVLDEPAPVESLNPSIPKELSAVIHRLLRKKPVDRYQTAEEVVGVLEAMEMQAVGT